jgi:hypothetical protein
MSRFYANIQGNRGEATRQGTEKSGLYGHIRGWNVGISVQCFVDPYGKDAIRVSLTSGSGGGKTSRTIGIYRQEDLDLPPDKIIRKIILND